MSPTRFPRFDPVTVTDAESGAIEIEVRGHYFTPSLMVMSIMTEEESLTAAVDTVTAAALARAITGWLTARAVSTRGHEDARAGGEPA